MQQTRKKTILKAAVCLALLAAALIGLRNQQYLLTLLNFVCMYMISVSGLDTPLFTPRAPTPAHC